MKKKLVIFACRRGRPRDVPLLRAGAHGAGYRFWLVLFPLSYPVLLLAALARWMGVDISVIFSDRSPADAWLARLWGRHASRMLWNYADEFPTVLQSAPANRVCFFEDRTHPVQLFRFAPQPRLRPFSVGARREVLFIGDATDRLEVPPGAGWWREQLADLQARHGYGFYLREEYRDLVLRQLPAAAKARRAHVLCKNLLRLWIVQSVHKAFKDRLVLVGPNWARLGLPSLPAAYSLTTRLRLYAEATVNLDCGSKSGDAALYPRSSEIISYAGAPLQVVCADSSLVFGSRMDEFVFRDEPSLHEMIERRLAEPEHQRIERAEWLAAQLEAGSLTMADSLRQLWDRPASGCAHPVPGSSPVKPRL